MALQGERQRVTVTLSDVASFGDRVVQVLQDYISSEINIASELRYAVQILNVTTRILGQLTKLLEQDPQTNSFSENQIIFSDEAYRYIETLAEECAVAINRIRTIITEDCSSESDPRFWKSLMTINDDGTKSLSIPEFDAAEFLRKCVSARYGRFARNVTRACSRVEYLHNFFFMIIQVAKVRELANLLSSGKASLQDVVECHERVRRVAQNVNIADRRGEVCSLRKRGIVPRGAAYYSSSSSSYDSESDSDSDIDTDTDTGSDSDSVVVIERKPRKANSKIRSVNVVVPDCPDPKPPRQVSSHEPVPLETIVEEVVEVASNKSQPPVYTEKNAPTVSKPVDATPTTDEKSRLDTKKADDLVQPIKLVKEGPAELTSLQKAPFVPPQESRLFKGSSGFGMKIKSLFRSKSALEAEMKSKLASDDASLTAFIINGASYRKVPHSAFHSLEWTHMRTIVSQVHDNTWFKTYSDLTDSEHCTLEEIMEPRILGSQHIKSELVVLKVLQKNRFNGWVRLMEDHMGTKDFIPQHENHRILLVIIRQKECSTASSNMKPSLEGPMEDNPNIAHAIPSEPFAFVENEYSRVIDLNILSPGPCIPLGVKRIPETCPTMNGPLPRPPPPPGRYPVPQLFNPRESRSYSDLKGLQCLYEPDARAALTTYMAFTLRRAPVTCHPFPSQPDSAPTWARCFVTREREKEASLIERVAQFNSRGISIIDMKLELNDFQSTQVSNIVDELANLDNDGRFVHRLVELSMLDRQLGFVREQSANTIVDVMHIIVQRAPKEGINCQELHRQLMSPRYPVRPPPPPAAPPVIIEPRRNIKPEIVRPCRQPQKPRKRPTYNSDSDESINSSSSGSSDGFQRRNRKNKNKNKRDCKSRVSRWSGRDDPSLVIFDKSLKGKDVVQCLLDRWIKNPHQKTEETVGKEEGKEKIVEM